MCMEGHNVDFMDSTLLLRLTESGLGCRMLLFAVRRLGELVISRMDQDGLLGFPSSCSRPCLQKIIRIYKDPQKY